MLQIKNVIKKEKTGKILRNCFMVSWLVGWLVHFWPLVYYCIFNPALWLVGWLVHFQLSVMQTGYGSLENGPAR
jgi:hypothetical protein